MAFGSDETRKHEPGQRIPPVEQRRLFADGEIWCVREIPAPAFDRRGGTHLIFESTTTVRRVRDFPPDWILLNDEELFALSLHV